MVRRVERGSQAEQLVLAPACLFPSTGRATTHCLTTHTADEFKAVPACFAICPVPMKCCNVKGTAGGVIELCVQGVFE